MIPDDVYYRWFPRCLFGAGVCVLGALAWEPLGAMAFVLALVAVTLAHRT